MCIHAKAHMIRSKVDCSNFRESVRPVERTREHPGLTSLTRTVLLFPAIHTTAFVFKLTASEWKCECRVQSMTIGLREPALPVVPSWRYC